MTKLKNEIIEYALTSLDREIYKLELDLSSKIYSELQFNILSKKLQSLYDKQEHFSKILEYL